MRRHVNLPVFLPMRGCPHQCVFCDQRRISGFHEPPDPDVKAGELRVVLASLDPEAEAEIAFFGGTFTGLPVGEQNRWLEMAGMLAAETEERRRRGEPAARVAGIRLSTRPDLMTASDAARLAKAGVTHVELGVQSLSDEVLAASGRGHAAQAAAEATACIREAGMSPGIQTMTGLPGDTQALARFTCDRVIALRPDEVRIYPALVLEGTELADRWRRGAYVPMALDEAVALCAELTERYESAGIRVLRVGLMESDGLRGQVLAGPHHPAFGELVRSERMLREMRGLLADAFGGSRGDPCGGLRGSSNSDPCGSSRGNSSAGSISGSSAESCADSTAGPWIASFLVPAGRLSQAAGHGGRNRRALEREWPGVTFRYRASAAERMTLRIERMRIR